MSEIKIRIVSPPLSVGHLPQVRQRELCMRINGLAPVGLGGDWTLGVFCQQALWFTSRNW